MMPYASVGARIIQIVKLCPADVLALLLVVVLPCICLDCAAQLVLTHNVVLIDNVVLMHNMVLMWSVVSAVQAVCSSVYSPG